MTSQELDTVYTELCKTMTRLGEAQANLFLARFALLAMTEIDHAERSLSLIHAAAEHLAQTPSH